VSRTDIYIFGCIIYWLSGEIVCVSGWPVCRITQPVVGGSPARGWAGLSRYVLM
jgi:hypothetical protein